MKKLFILVIVIQFLLTILTVFCHKHTLVVDENGHIINEIVSFSIEKENFIHYYKLHIERKDDENL
jgi:hypothetical protein